MINEKEIEAVNLSATKKDFYQIWNELLETAGKLSKRWSPESTNESDPGIVLLKVLTAIADKLNYTIDKNTLEAFMPSAAQEDSMRKLCEMMGYNMKYYQSATTEVTISYIGDELESSITLPAFTYIKNTDDDISYFTTEPITLNSSITARQVTCIEGEAVLCGDDTENIISLTQLDDNFRYFLPESQIAENGFFVKNIDDGIEYSWEKVDNLNTQAVGSKCYKFGFDSKTQMPYLQFPEDIGNIIKDGLEIKYTRTNGVNGNISYNTLNTLEIPESLSETLTSTDFAVKNASAAVNGKDKESLTDAYNNYKRTIGTFDTLVTCRDYMNKIYQMTTDDANTTPLVSNIIVSDIRDDINKAVNLCTFNEHGILYVDKSLQSSNTDKITHFDLVLYPFTNITGTVSEDNYNNSFKYSGANLVEIKSNLENNKTISHNFIAPDTDDIVLIKNYLKLKAKITTTSKVTAIEEKIILKNIYKAIYENFNSRQIDFGEEIPFDSILEVIQNADTNIKNVSLDEPILYTQFVDKNGNDKTAYAQYYNKLALRNVLAGRLPLFDYNEDFEPSYNEAAYENGLSPIYPAASNTIKTIESEFNVSAHTPTEAMTLQENEVIQFRAPNFKTTLTYPAYVNYFYYAGNGVTKTIKANTEYKLDTNEWLAINYTPSVTNDDGTTSSGSVINKVYPAGTIIRPNFDLQDSITYKTSHTPSKTSGYDSMPSVQKSIIDANEGMFTLGVNDQIEIRDIVKVVFNEAPTNIYWFRNDEDILSVTDNKIIFDFDEDPVYKEDGTTIDYYKSYTLKEEEYIYYTDASKIDLAWYGNGTKITRSSANVILYKYDEDKDALTEKIANDGLLAAIPWISYTFDTNNFLTLIEQQYINLVAGNLVKSVKTTSESTGICKLTKDWTKIYSAEYKYSTDTEDTYTSLPTISASDFSWYARSILNINMSPDTVQTLHSTGTASASKITEDKINLIYTNTSVTPTTLTPEWDSTASNFTALSLKANYILQSSFGKMSSLDNTEKYTTAVKIKTIKLDTTNTYSDIGNFGDGNWTKAGTENKILHIELPDTNHHGLIMFYDLNPDTTLKNHAYLTVTNNADLTICNASNTSSSTLFDTDKKWWDTGKADSKYYLRPGINIVDIPISCTVTLNKNAATADTANTIIFSNLKVVKYTSNNYVINPRIDYKTNGQSTAVAQILKDIEAVDPNYNFYYSAVIDSSLAIDFNTNITDTTDAEYEKLSTPKIYYDYNNINNKFVISEIDADYLKTGITLTNSSRK